MALGSPRRAAELLISPPFAPPVAVALEPIAGSKRRDCSGGCELLVVAARNSPGHVEVAVDTTRIPLEQGVAERLLGVWEAVLLKTAYPRERLVGPDGNGVGYGKFDGTRYEFSSYGMSGETHSPRAGSLMHEYVELATNLARARRGTSDAYWAETVRSVISLEARLQHVEPCELLVPANR